MESCETLSCQGLIFKFLIINEEFLVARKSAACVHYVPALCTHGPSLLTIVWFSENFGLALDIFQHFFTTEIMDNIVASRDKCRYAKQKMMTPTTTHDKWTPPTRLLRLRLTWDSAFAGIVKLPSSENDWRRDVQFYCLTNCIEDLQRDRFRDDPTIPPFPRTTTTLPTPGTPGSYRWPKYAPSSAKMLTTWRGSR